MTSATLVTTANAAHILGIQAATLRKWRHLGRGPTFVRYGTGAGARCYYRLSDIMRWLEDRTFESTAGERIRSVV